jgi:hypothetical protein
METGSIKIGPEFFAKAKNDYADWRFALIREFAQNSIDAPGSDEIHIGLSVSHGTTTELTLTNNGEPMTKETLTGKLLSLGSSGKNFAGSVGGFGKAKELLYLGWESYRIHTGKMLVEGCGANYTITEREHLYGTKSHIEIQGRHSEEIESQIKRFAALAQWSGTLTLNGQKLATNLRKGSPRKELGWGTIYTNNTFNGLLIVRIGGIPMFCKSINYKGTVLIELKGASDKVLTSNRDGLIQKFQNELDQFIVSISTNSRKALKEVKKVEKKIYPGYKLAGKAVTVSNQENDPDAEYKEVTAADLIMANIAATTQKGNNDDAPTITVEQIARVFRPEFHVRNELEGTIPEWFLPGSKFSDNSKRLISTWISLLVELACLTECTKPFSVGFHFDDEARGLHECAGGADTIYVNPLQVVKKEGKPRQLKTYWSFTSAGYWELLSLAMHEFAHHYTGCDHNEDYSYFLTDLTTKVFQNRTRFSRHFSAKTNWPE